MARSGAAPARPMGPSVVMVEPPDALQRRGGGFGSEAPPGEEAERLGPRLVDLLAPGEAFRVVRRAARVVPLGGFRGPVSPGVLLQEGGGGVRLLLGREFLHLAVHQLGVHPLAAQLLPDEDAPPRLLA